MKTRLRTSIMLSSLVACAMILAARAEGEVCNLHLATDNVPDYTDLESFVASATSGCRTPEEKCIAVWRWGRRSRRQTSCAGEDGRLIWDPILHYNSYGAMNCGVISALNITSFLQLGYKARYIQLGDHTVSEVSWDDGRTWHLFDSSMSFFCYNHEGQVASCQEIREAHACELSGGKSEPGHYYLYHGAPQCRSHLGADGWRCAGDQPVGYERTLVNGAASYTDGFSVDQYVPHARFGQRYILNLRPREAYTRHWRPLDRDNPAVAEADRPDYYRPVQKGDPDEQYGLHNLRGNGVWVFRPDLKSPDCRELLYDARNIADAGEGKGPALHPAATGQPAAVVFKVAAANAITSMRIEADGLRAGGDDVLRVSVSRCAGIDWTTVWQSQQTGAQPIRLRLRDEVAGVTECLVRFEMSAGRAATDVGLDRLDITTITQLDRRTLPKLTLGTNQVRLAADEQAASAVVWPPLHAGLYRRTAYATENVSSDQQPDGMYKATLGSGVDGKECFAVWRVEVPTDITGVTYGAVATNRSGSSRVSLEYGFDGATFTEFYRKSDGDAPFEKQVLHTVERGDVPTGARQAFVRAVFFSQKGAATYNMPGIQDLLIRVNHQPRNPGFQPIEVTYNWTEHRESGDVTRSHTELAESLPHRYTVNVAGVRDPTMNFVRVNLKGSSPDGDRVRYGYGDGEDVGDRCEPKRVLLTWGTNLARDKPYQASRPASAESRNADKGGRELTNGRVIAPTDIMAQRSVQPATAFWAAGDPVAFVVDLGREETIGGVRVSTHQPNAGYCHPARVEVAVSSDGQTWQPAGTIRHDDLWNPPVDYEPWEHDDSPDYQALPAGGRLAYSFPLVLPQPIAGRFVRFTFTPQQGRGMGISELQVFDRVQSIPAPFGGDCPEPIAAK